MFKLPGVPGHELRQRPQGRIVWVYSQQRFTGQLHFNKRVRGISQVCLLTRQRRKVRTVAKTLNQIQCAVQDALLRACFADAPHALSAASTSARPRAIRSLYAFTLADSLRADTGCRGTRRFGHPFDDPVDMITAPSVSKPCIRGDNPGSAGHLPHAIDAFSRYSTNGKNCCVHHANLAYSQTGRAADTCRNRGKSSSWSVASAGS